MGNSPKNPEITYESVPKNPETKKEQIIPGVCIIYKDIKWFRHLLTYDRIAIVAQRLRQNANIKQILRLHPGWDDTTHYDVRTIRKYQLKRLKKFDLPTLNCIRKLLESGLGIAIIGDEEHVNAIVDWSLFEQFDMIFIIIDDQSYATISRRIQNCFDIFKDGHKIVTESHLDDI
jgi:hypothetical protein